MLSPKESPAMRCCTAAAGSTKQLFSRGAARAGQPRASSAAKVPQRARRWDAKAKSRPRQILAGRRFRGSVVEDPAARALPTAVARPGGVEPVVELGFAEVVVELAFLVERRLGR